MSSLSKSDSMPRPVEPQKLHGWSRSPIRFSFSPSPLRQVPFADNVYPSDWSQIPPYHCIILHCVISTIHVAVSKDTCVCWMSMRIPKNIVCEYIHYIIYIYNRWRVICVNINVSNIPIVYQCLFSITIIIIMFRKKDGYQQSPYIRSYQHIPLDHIYQWSVNINGFFRCQMTKECRKFNAKCQAQTSNLVPTERAERSDAVRHVLVDLVWLGSDDGQSW